MATSPRVAPLPSNVIPFAYEFVKRMREETETKKDPSVRQTQAIPQLLSARYFKHGKLTLDDFIDAAVYTTYPLDQDLARRIAEDIILGKKKEKQKPPAPEVEKEEPKAKQNDRLAQVMDQIRREQELAKTIKKDKVEAGYEYLKGLQEREDKTLYNAASDYLNDGDIVLCGLSSDEELRQEAASELLDKMGGLSSQDIRNAETLDVLDDLCEAPNAAEQLAAKALRGDDDVLDEFKQLADRDPSTAAKALKHMEELGVPDDKKLEKMDKTLQDSISNLSEAADYARELERVPENIDEKIQDAPSQYPLSDAREFVDSIKQSTGEDFTEDLLKAYDEQYDQGASENVDMQQLSEYPNGSDSWDSLLEKETENAIEKAQSRSSPSDYLRQQVQQQMDMMKNMSNATAQRKWQESAQRMSDASVETSQSRTHLRQTVRFLNSMGASPSQESVREAGESLGMSEDEILEMLNPSFQVIKKLIEAGVSNFERLSNLISSAGLTENQLSELANLADSLGNQSALGAVAHEDFGAALGMQGQGSRGRAQVDPNRAERVMGGLLGGPATNVIKIWYSYRDELPPELRDRLQRIARRLLIDLGMRYAKSTMGSSMLGGIQQSTTVRPFRIGDDIDLIDLEETIDSLLSQGRSSFETIESEDFLITETYQGHRAFFWALDKSGSMDSAEKLGMLAISVMAGLYGVQKDDFGVVLFDDKTHIVKQIPERNVSVEKVATDLLDVRAGGGTGGSSSLKLALRNFEDTRAKEKILIFGTDAYLSDQKQCEDLALEMKQQEIKLILLVPKTSFDARSSRKIAEKAHGVVVEIGSVEELPEKLLRLTNY
ncbi:MAG: hypothetical protein RTU30_09545 [Candidatus Thorarchaeota archaeon]